MTEITISLEDDGASWTYFVAHPIRDVAIADALGVLISKQSPSTSTSSTSETAATDYWPGTLTPKNFYDEPGKFQELSKLNQQKVQIESLQATVANQQNELRILRDKQRETDYLFDSSEELRRLTEELKQKMDDEDDDGLDGVREPRR
jgi:hypothetical protein